MTGGPDRQGRGYDGAELSREWTVPGEDERAAEGSTEGCRVGKGAVPEKKFSHGEGVLPQSRSGRAGVSACGLAEGRIPERKRRTTEFPGGGRRNGAEKEYIEKMASSSQKCAAGLRGGGLQSGKERVIFTALPDPSFGR